MKKTIKKITVFMLLVAVFGSTVCFAGNYDFVTPVSSPKYDWSSKSPNGNILNTTTASTNAKNPGKTTVGEEDCYYVGDVTTGSGVQLALPGNGGSFQYKLTEGKMLGVTIDFMLKKTADIESATMRPYILVMSRIRPLFTFIHKANTDTFYLDVNGTNHQNKPLSYSKWYTLKFVVNISECGCYYEISERGASTSIISGTKTGLTDNGGDMNTVRFIRKNEENASAITAETATAKCAEFYIDNYQVTRENFVIGTPDITVTPSSASASVVIKNESRNEKTTPVFILGVYDEDGALLGVDMKTETISARTASNNATMPEKNLQCSVNVIGNKPIKTARAFVWTSWNGMIPYIDAVSEMVETSVN